jgi:hypothetical protein
MGSPLSPVMANLFMEEYEKKELKALATATLQKPGSWFKYVDDTLSSSRCHGLYNLQKFLEHFNSLYLSIKLFLKYRRMIKLYLS